MGKKILIIILILSFGFILNRSVNADWWERPTTRPTQPNEDRFLPTLPPQYNPSPTSKVSPTSPPVGGPEVTPSDNGGNGGNDEDDPCAAGKSYSGPYCGWTPDVDNSDVSGGGGNGEGGGIGGLSEGPAVSGLSETAGEEVGASDIMLLGGILCLLLYAKSKLNTDVANNLIGKRNRR